MVSHSLALASPVDTLPSSILLFERIADEQGNDDDDYDDDDDDEGEEVADPDNQMQVVKHSSAQKTELEEAAQTLDYKNIKRDNVFLAFQERTSHYRDQILRYYRLESSQIYEPLWVSDTDKLPADQVANCETCGAKRTFEFQVRFDNFFLFPLDFLFSISSMILTPCRLCHSSSIFSASTTLRWIR